MYIDGSTHNGGWKQIATGVMDASTCAAHMMTQVNINGDYHFEKYSWWRLRWRSNTSPISAPFGSFPSMASSSCASSMPSADARL